MKNKGFTLIELVGTIVIISLIILIITPAISNSLKKGITDADEKTKQGIILAAKNYFSDNKYQTCVELSDLQSQGYIDDNIKWPSNQNPIEGSVSKTGNNYKFSEGSCK